MRAPSSGQSRASRAPRCRGKYAVCPRPSSFGPGAGLAANGRGTTGAQTPALPPLGPWRRIALRARTSWGSRSCGDCCSGLLSPHKLPHKLRPHRPQVK
ncbi:DNA-directed RNA polymerases I, II, and III subunit RPABC4 isoform X2 [Pseudorca crassidens]|uniref:DNA-directed RNA polymerases I, II, and III subunit RPABC4 isoform X2 n=1 Tax=Pseudorca crassidens TaxID=82174 RepID=UPI00352ED7BE